MLNLHGNGHFFLQFFIRQIGKQALAPPVPVGQLHGREVDLHRTLLSEFLYKGFVGRCPLAYNGTRALLLLPLFFLKEI